MNFTGVTTIKGDFRSSTLKEAVLPPNATRIEADAFQWSSVMEVCVIPDGVTNITARQFYGCNNHPAIIFLPTTPPVYPSGTAVWGYCNGKIYVPDDSISAYNSAGSWSSVTVYGFSQLAIDHPDYYERYITQG